MASFVKPRMTILHLLGSYEETTMEHTARKGFIY